MLFITHEAPCTPLVRFEQTLIDTKACVSVHAAIDTVNWLEVILAMYIMRVVHSSVHVMNCYARQHVSKHRA